MRVRVKLDQRGLDEVARSFGMKQAIDEAGEAVADNVRSMGIRVEHEPGDIPLPVEVDTAIEDNRATSFVTIAHPSGDAVQAKHGALTKAAAEAGLDVRGA